MKTVQRPLSLLPFAVALLIFGCSSASSDTLDGAMVRESKPASANTGDSAEAQEGTIKLERVLGSVVDAQGDALPEISVTVCGEICFQGESDADGQFAVEVNHSIIPGDYSLSTHGSHHLSSFYYPLPSDLPAGDYKVGSLTLVALPTDGPLLQDESRLEEDMTPPAQELESGAVTLIVPEGTGVQLDFAALTDGDDGRTFRAAEVPKEFREEFAPSLPGAQLFALGPFETSFHRTADGAPGVGLRIKNTANYPAGSDVKVYAVGSYFQPEWLPPGNFGLIGVAQVSSDGTSVELESGSPGLQRLTWLALTPADGK